MLFFAATITTSYSTGQWVKTCQLLSLKINFLVSVMVIWFAILHILGKDTGHHITNFVQTKLLSCYSRQKLVSSHFCLSLHRRANHDLLHFVWSCANRVVFSKNCVAFNKNHRQLTSTTSYSTGKWLESCQFLTQKSNCLLSVMVDLACNNILWKNTGHHITNIVPTKLLSSYSRQKPVPAHSHLPSHRERCENYLH